MNEILATNKPISGHCLGERSLDLVHDNPGECLFYWSRDMITEKRCTKCGETKPVSEFYKDKKGRDGLHPRCKECLREYKRGWHKANREKCLAWCKKWYDANAEKVVERNRAWHKANPGKHREYNLARRSTPKGYLRHGMSRNIRKALKAQKTGRHWESLVGYTIHDLMKHLEKKFQPGMTWENMGEWHIDHIVPVSAFNYKTPEDIDFKKCWALKNLQPLWASENISKGAKLDKPFQPSLAFGG